MKRFTGILFFVVFAYYQRECEGVCSPYVPTGSYFVPGQCSSTTVNPSGSVGGAYCTKPDASGLIYRCHCSNSCGYVCDPDPTNKYCPPPATAYCTTDPICTCNCVTPLVKPNPDCTCKCTCT